MRILDKRLKEIAHNEETEYLRSEVMEIAEELRFYRKRADFISYEDLSRMFSHNTRIFEELKYGIEQAIEELENNIYHGMFFDLYNSHVKPIFKKHMSKYIKFDEKTE